MDALQEHNKKCDNPYLGVNLEDYREGYFRWYCPVCDWLSDLIPWADIVER